MKESIVKFRIAQEGKERLTQAAMENEEVGNRKL
jgi:hypothetical protein